MLLKIKNYTLSDIFSLSLKVASFPVICLMLMSFVQAIVSTLVVAFVTANFVDNTIMFFSHSVNEEVVFSSLLVLILVIGINFS